MAQNPNHIRKVEAAKERYEKMKRERKYQTLFILQTIAEENFVCYGTVERWLYGGKLRVKSS